MSLQIQILQGTLNPLVNLTNHQTERLDRWWHLEFPTNSKVSKASVAVLVKNESVPVYGNDFSLCVSPRTSTSSATRLLWSTWVALTTMQRKWRDNHPSIFPLRGPQTNRRVKTRERRPETTWTLNLFFLGARLKDEFYTNKDKKQQQKQQQELCVWQHPHSPGVSLRSWWVWRLSMCNPYTYLSVPVWRTYNTCVLWSAISNMNQWNTNGFWTGIMILYVYKKTKTNKKNNTKSLDICCTLNGLFILNFVSIGLVY